MQKLHITIKPNQTIWFTSDLHLNHRNILKFCHRPFENIKEMNEAIINNWNDCVKDDDVVFVIGDFDWFPHRHEMKKTINKLKGEIYMILGNHDTPDSFEFVDNPRFHLCQDIVHVFFDGILPAPIAQKIVEVVLCHYPLLTWSHIKHSIHLFGHIHSESIDNMIEFDEPLALRKNQLDIGIDAHDYKPVSFAQVLREIGDLSEFFTVTYNE